MRILLITPYFYPHKGGSQQYAEELHYHLKQTNPGIDIDVLCYNTDKSPEKEEYRGMTIYRVPCLEILPGQFAIPNYFKLIRLLSKLGKKNKYSFVNSHTRFFESSWWAPLAAKFLGTQSVLTDHCADHPIHRSKLVTRFARLIDRYFVPLFMRAYDVVTVTNRATLRFVKGLKVEMPKIIYGGVDYDSYKPYRRGGKRILPKVQRKFKDKDIVVTFLGRMIYSKGPQLLLKAAKRVLAQKKNVYFVFAGPGELEKKLSVKSNKNILFTGSLERKEVLQLLKNTDILVHPSLHNEGFPNVLLEAGASGCAVIATNRGGTREIILNNKTGLMVQANATAIQKALLDLLENENKRKRLALNLRKRIKERFDWKKIVVDYQKLMRHFLPPALLTSQPKKFSLRTA